MINKVELKRMREIAEKATPGPWGPWTGNYPFYVDVRKPSASLSKHDSDRPTYWSYQDALFVLEFNPQKVLELLEMIEKENENVTK